MKKKARNEGRPGYKKTKIGWIPEEWECKVFSSIAKIKMGLSPNGKSYNTEGVGFPLINGPTEFTERYPIKKQWTSSPTKVCNLGDILLCVRGSSTGRMNIANDKYCIGRGVASISCKEKKSYPIFIEQLLINITYRILKLTTGSTFPNIDKNTLSSIKVGVPPLPEQKKIAEVLSAWDRAIEQVGKLIDAKQRLKKGLMQQLLSGKIRFPEFAGSEKRKVKSEKLRKGQLPEGWKACKLGDCFKERKETNPDLPLLAITSDRGVIPRDEVERKDTSNADKSKYKRIAPGDIGYNTMRMWQGVSAVSTLEGIVSPAYTICTPKKGHLSSFFGYLFKYPPMIHLFQRFSQGLVSDTLNLKFRHFSQVKANVPSVAEQSRIAALLSTCDREIELLRRKETALREQKKGLMQKLLTGEIRVKSEKLKVKS